MTLEVAFSRRPPTLRLADPVATGRAPYIVLDVASVTFMISGSLFAGAVRVGQALGARTDRRRARRLDGAAPWHSVLPPRAWSWLLFPPARVAIHNRPGRGG